MHWSCIGKMTTAAPLSELLQAKLQPLRELGERYGVEKLELFGLAARGEWEGLEVVAGEVGGGVDSGAGRGCEVGSADC